MANANLSLITRLAEFDETRRLPLMSNLLIKLAVQLSIWSHNHKSRKILANLTADQMKDIGLLASDLEFEARKRFWVR